MVGSLPANEDQAAALNFLKRSDLTRILPTKGEAIFSPAEEFLRVYRIRQASARKAGTVIYGLASLLSALEKLHPTELLTITGFVNAEWYGHFWSNQVDQLVGFALVERRSPEEEQERLDWFRRNLS
jgi:hypothetical protein